MFEQTFRNIDDVLRKEAGCTTELDYTEQTSWLLFLKYLEALEQVRAMEAALEGKRYAFILEPPYRWESWAAPKVPEHVTDGQVIVSCDTPCQYRRNIPRVNPLFLLRIAVMPNEQKREQVPVKAEIAKRRWCLICDDWVVPLSDGKGCPYCWCPTMSEAEKEEAES